MTKRSATSLMGKSRKPSARNTMGKLQPETNTVGRFNDSTPARTAALEGVAPKQVGEKHHAFARMHLPRSGLNALHRLFNVFIAGYIHDRQTHLAENP